MRSHPIRYALELVGAPVPLNHAALAPGVALHVQHAGLHTLLVQVGPMQRAYITLPACRAECQPGTCLTPGCLAGAFARVLHSTAPQWRLRVAGALASRPYTRAIVAVPGARAQPLTGALLHPWADARVRQRWYAPHQRSALPRWRTDVLLLVGADGPDPAAALRALGWEVLALPPAVALLAPARAARHGGGLLPALLTPEPDPARAPVLLTPQRRATRRVSSPLDTPVRPRPDPPADAAAVTVAGRVAPSVQVAPQTTFVSAAQAGTWPGAVWHTASQTPCAPHGVPPHTLLDVALLDAGPTTNDASDAFVGALPHVQQLGVLLGMLPDDMLAHADDDAASDAPLSAVVEAAPDDGAFPPAPAVAPEGAGDAAAAAAAPAASPWPDGPPPLRAADLGALLERLIDDPVLTEGPAAGLTKNRLRALLPPNTVGADAVAMTLLLWLDAAGVIAPVAPERQWRAPRPFSIGMGLTAIAAALHATPLPDDDAVAAVNATLKKNG